MFFIVILAGLLYVYRWFRKVHSAVDSRFISPSALPGEKSSWGSAPLLDRLRGVSSSRPGVWADNECVSFDKLKRLVSAVVAELKRLSSRSVVLRQVNDLEWAVVQLAAPLAQVEISDSVGVSLSSESIQGMMSSKLDGLSEASSDLVIERILDGVSLTARDSVRLSREPVSVRLLLWAVGSSQGPAVFSASMSESEATVFASSVSEIRAQLAALGRDLGSSIQGRWALGLADGAAASKKGSWLARSFFDMKMVIAETLIFPSAVSRHFSKRAAHLFVQKERLSETEVAKLEAFGMKLHVL
jgi:hypothetical protein